MRRWLPSSIASDAAATSCALGFIGSAEHAVASAAHEIKSATPLLLVTTWIFWLVESSAIAGSLPAPCPAEMSDDVHDARSCEHRITYGLSESAGLRTTAKSFCAMGSNTARGSRAAG